MLIENMKNDIKTLNLYLTMITVNFLKFQTQYSKNLKQKVGCQGLYLQNACQNGKQGRHWDWVYTDCQSNFGKHLIRPPDKSVYWKNIFLFSHPIHMLWVLKKPSQQDGSFEHPKHIFKLIGKEIIAILCLKN